MFLVASSPLVQALKSPHFSVVPTVVLSVFQGAEQIDLSDRLIAFSVGNSMNDTCGTGVLTFAVGRGTTSLSPLFGGSIYQFVGRPVLDPNLDVVLNIEVLEGTGASRGSFTFFMGRVDRVAVTSPTTISVQCRDVGARFLNRMISEAAQFGVSGGSAVETVMEQILAANGFSASSLYTPVSPGFQITDFYTGEISVLESLRILAQQIGWDVRHFAGGVGGAGGFQLRFYDPGRTRIVPDDTITSARYSAITDLSVGDEDVRNSWDVYYPDAVAPAHAEDATSIARYGLRYARIGEDRALNIRTLGAAQTLADTALADTKDPFASHEIRMPFYPVVQLNDLHTYQANGQEYDSDLTLAVVGYRHDWKAGNTMPTTTMQARGQPIAAYREYRKSKDPEVIVSASPPDPNRYAPEGTVWKHRPNLV